MNQAAIHALYDLFVFVACGDEELLDLDACVQALESMTHVAPLTAASASPATFASASVTGDRAAIWRQSPKANLFEPAASARRFSMLGVTSCAFMPSVSGGGSPRRRALESVGLSSVAGAREMVPNGASAAVLVAP
jgi:hypothetical protein